MMALASADRAKLAKFLGLLGSNHAGERDAAGLAADRLVRSRGLTWAEVLEQHGATCSPGYRPAPAQYEDPAAADLRVCGQRLDLLTTWELAFITDLARRSIQRLSSKQRAILADVAARIRATPANRP